MSERAQYLADLAAGRDVSGSDFRPAPGESGRFETIDPNVREVTRPTVTDPHTYVYWIIGKLDERPDYPMYWVGTMHGRGVWSPIRASADRFDTGHRETLRLPPGGFWIRVVETEER